MTSRPASSAARSLSRNEPLQPEAGVVHEEVDRPGRVGEPGADLRGRVAVGQVGDEHLDVDAVASSQLAGEPSRRARSRATSTRSVPSRARRSAKARPIPADAPVTSAVAMLGTVCRRTPPPGGGRPVGRVHGCASPPGTSTRSAPASTASRPGWQRTDVDVLAMQETKAKDEQFPRDRFAALGYEVAHHGMNQWNGVAILSRVGLDDVQVGFDGDPGWGEPLAAEARSIGATCGGIRMWSLYVPNGRAIGDPHMAYKLDWLARLRERATEWAADGTPVALCGDWNIAPQDDDVWSMEYYLDKSHVSPPERAAFNAFLEAGFVDVVRPHAPGPGRLHLLGLPAARLPEAARHAHRLRARLTDVRGPGRRGGHRPRGAQGRRRQRPRAGRRRARGLTGCRPGRRVGPVGRSAGQRVRMPLA